MDARGPHTYLGVGNGSSTWIKVQIDRARLLEHCDHEVIAGPPEGGAGNRRARTDHDLTLDAAKHIGMMSGTDNGTP